MDCAGQRRQKVPGTEQAELVAQGGTDHNRGPDQKPACRWSSLCALAKDHSPVSQKLNRRVHNSQTLGMPEREKRRDGD
jgi:hypothetical protein